jgi:hypothetical protein
MNVTLEVNFESLRLFCAIRYQALGLVKPPKTREELKQAYLKAAFGTHPDSRDRAHGGDGSDDNGTSNLSPLIKRCGFDICIIMYTVLMFFEIHVQMYYQMVSTIRCTSVFCNWGFQCELGTHI